MPIKQWPNSERPREKLCQHGSASLSDAELLAIFLRTGVSGKSAVTLAHDLLLHFGSLHRLCNSSLAEFKTIHGVGQAKYAQLQAALELARRTLKENLHHGKIFTSPDDVRDWLRLLLAHLPYEVFLILLLDNAQRLIVSHELFRGTLNQTTVYPREVVKLAIMHNASAVILAHNHPSGTCEPSQADEQLTEALKKALALVDVAVLDHFIVAGNAPPTSFAERGLLSGRPL